MQRKYWTHIFLWVGLIYSTLYIVRPICEFLKKVTPFAAGMNALVLACLFVIVLHFLKHNNTRKWHDVALLVLALGCYAFGLATIKYPEEKLHFIEYGFLSFLVYRALRLDLSRGVSFLLAFFMASFFGYIDELIQGVLPNRYYQTADVVLNSVSALLGLMLTKVLVKDENVYNELS